jgi:hypothetical protein
MFAAMSTQTPEAAIAVARATAAHLKRYVSLLFPTYPPKGA